MAQLLELDTDEPLTWPELHRRNVAYWLLYNHAIARGETEGAARARALRYYRAIAADAA